MNVPEEELIGKQIDRVPKRAPGYDCNARKVDRSGAVNTFRGYCNARAGKGTDTVGEGRCSRHGGKSTGAPHGEANGNHVHGGYSQSWISSLDGSDAQTYPELVEEVTAALQDGEYPGVAEMLDDPIEQCDVARYIAAELVAVRFHRSRDPEFLRGWEQICVAYNLYGDLGAASGPDLDES